MAIYPNFCLANILVIGDVILDRYWYGFIEKISQEAPVPIMQVNFIDEQLGGAANVAVNIASLGAKVKLIGVVGNDNFAKILKKLLTKANVTYDLLVSDVHPTITKLRVMTRNQQIMRFDFEEYFNNFNTIFLIEKVKSILSKFKMIVISDYLKGTLDSIEEIIICARSMGIPILIDPKGLDFSRYQGATILTPNLSEFEKVVGVCRNEEILINRGMQLIHDCKISSILVTRAEQSMILLRLGKQPMFFHNKAKNISNVVGAGDTVIAVLAASICSGSTIEDSCMLANIAAGLVISKSGTSSIVKNELKSAFFDGIDIIFGTVDEMVLKKMMLISKCKGEKLVMTNGVFDILHYGHISYLINAKKLGDRLIVAVNSDDSTKKLKGIGRPINTLSKRMAVLSALKVVDWVVPFYEDTPRRLISSLLPDILVKGGDYHLSDVVGGQEVLTNGGEVKVLNFEDDSSTSNIANLINNNI